MTPLDAIILGLVEGITEYLPVSSTGHLILVSRWLGLAESPEAKQSIDTFNIVVQGAAVLAVAALYRVDVVRMIRAIIARMGLVRPAPTQRRDFNLARNLLLSFLPAAIIGLGMRHWIKEHLFGVGPVILALALGGLVMIALAPWVRARARDATGVGRDGATLTVPRALAIGCMQCAALFPGTSRSMVTILGALATGMAPREAAKYSFLLALPTLGGACLYESYGLWTSGGMLDQLGGLMPVTLGMITAFVTAAISVKWLVGYLGRGGFAIFGWWRIVLAGAIATMVLTGAISWNAIH